MQTVVIHIRKPCNCYYYYIILLLAPQCYEWEGVSTVIETVEIAPSMLLMIVSKITVRN